MKRELKKEELAKLYRQFSRQKYNKYKHQFPRMRESELVSKIIKEWEGLTLNQKENLYATYTTQKHISDDKSESSEKKVSPGSSKEKKKKEQSKSVTKGPKWQSSGTPQKLSSSGVRVFIEGSSSGKKGSPRSESSDFARDAVKKDFEVSDSVSKELGVPTKLAKKKRISKKESKQPRTEYLKFFKFYYEKLTKQHPRWNANQISTIIKLLWKKKLTTDKVASKTTDRLPRPNKKVTGRMAFRKAQNYTGLMAIERWKQLPVQSKKYWVGKGENKVSGDVKRTSTTIGFKKMKPVRKNSESSVNTQSAKNLNFMKKKQASQEGVNKSDSKLVSESRN